MAEPSLKDMVSELERRKATQKAKPAFLDKRFPKQTAFIKDPALKKAALCTARAGKSYGVGLYLFKEAYENPGANCLYLALTRDSAKRILWKDILKVINRKLGLGSVFNETALTVSLPNGSVIYLLGADSSDDEREKILGQKFKLVVIDEAASFSIDLHDLVYRILDLRVSDERGTICLIGTPGNLIKSFFHKVTTGAEPGWSVHKWSALENPYQRDAHLEKLAEIEKTRPLYKETPAFKQMYLGEWVVDNEKLVYRFADPRNVFTQLPKYAKGRWHYVLGIDLGWEDDKAFVVVAYHDFDPNLYVLSSFKKSHMLLTDMAKKIIALNDEFEFDVVVVDGSAKDAIQDIQHRFGLTLTPADKTGKMDFIDIMNAELIQGKVKLQAQDCLSLIDELQTLIVNERSAKREEDPSCQNHAADATLYAWRHCYQYLSEVPAPERPKLGTPEFQLAYLKEEEARMEAELDRRLQSERDPDADPFDQSFGPSFDAWGWME